VLFVPSYWQWLDVLFLSHLFFFSTRQAKTTNESAEYGADILSSCQDPNALKVNDPHAFFIFVDFPCHEFLYDFH
jgi:hypothetical protein